MDAMERWEIDTYLAIEDRLLSRLDDLPCDVAEDILAASRLAHLRLWRILAPQERAEAVRPLTVGGPAPPATILEAAA